MLHLTITVCMFLVLVRIKFLGVSGIPGGTGSAQEKAVIDMIVKWDIFEGVTCVVTQGNLCEEVLWLACNPHMWELHSKHVVIEVTGVTKDQ